MGSTTFIKSLTADVFLFTIGVRILNQIEKLILSTHSRISVYFFSTQLISLP